MKRNIIIMLLPLAAFISGGCSEEAVNTDTPDSVELSEYSLTFGPDGGPGSVTVTSSGTWRVSGNSDWVKPSVQEGKSGDILTFEASPNTGTAPLEAEFKVFSGSAVAKVKLVSAVDDYILVDGTGQSSVSASNAASVIMVKVRTNINDLSYSYSDGGDSWIEFKERIDALGSAYLYFDVMENIAYKSRSCDITVSGAGKSTVVHVIQAQTDYLEADSMSYEFDLSEREFSLTVTSNVYYEISTDSEFITITDEGTLSPPEESGLSSRTVSFSIAKCAATRVSRILLKDKEGELLRSIPVRQQNPEPVYVNFEDMELLAVVEMQGWIIRNDDDRYELADAGVTGSSLTLKTTDPWGGRLWLESVKGLGIFPELTELVFENVRLECLDISDCKKIDTIIYDDISGLSEVRFGQNPISSFAMNAVCYEESFIASGDNLTVVDFSCNDESDLEWWDNCESIDVSGCPALESLKTVREYYDSDSSSVKTKLRTIYVTAAQQAAIDAGTLTVEKSDITQIVVK